MAVETVETSAMWCRLKRNLKTEIEHLKKSQADSKQYNNYSNYSNIYIIYSIITHNLVCGPNFPSLLILSVGCGWSEFAASNLLSLCHTRSFPWTMADRVNDVNVWKINALGLLLLCAWWRWPYPLRGVKAASIWRGGHILLPQDSCCFTQHAKKVFQMFQTCEPPICCWATGTLVVWLLSQS